MTLGVVIVVAVLLVLGAGYLIFRLMRGSQTIVPQVTDKRAARLDPVVGIDSRGREITASQEAPEAPRNGAAFESLLQAEIRDRGSRQPSDEEG